MERTGSGQAVTASTGMETCSKQVPAGVGVPWAKYPRDTTRTTRLWGILICIVLVFGRPSTGPAQTNV